jgi:uncharacterized membrane protein YkoI
MRTKVLAALGAAALIAAGGTGVSALAGPSSGGSPSRLDDGKDLLPQSKITEQHAIGAAQKAASGGLNEVDLEHYSGRLVWNVDVGSQDVKVDADTGKVVGSSKDD